MFTPDVQNIDDLKIYLHSPILDWLINILYMYKYDVNNILMA